MKRTKKLIYLCNLRHIYNKLLSFKIFELVYLFFFFFNVVAELILQNNLF